MTPSHHSYSRLCAELHKRWQKNHYHLGGSTLHFYTSLETESEIQTLSEFLEFSFKDLKYVHIAETSDTTPQTLLSSTFTPQNGRCSDKKATSLHPKKHEYLSRHGSQTCSMSMVACRLALSCRLLCSCCSACCSPSFKRPVSFSSRISRLRTCNTFSSNATTSAARLCMGHILCMVKTTVIDT